MGEINLLARYPRSKRNIKARLANKDQNRRLALQFGREYFDGTRDQGYGGYRYDGRWQPVAEDIVAHFGLKAGDRVLDVGCAKGFLVKDLMRACPGLEAFGLDVSDYAVRNCEADVVGRLHVGNATSLPFPDASFQAVISVNTVHNLDRSGCVTALREIQRVAAGRAYVQVDAYRNEAERALFEDWMLTAKTYGKPEDWLMILEEAGYTGDYFWTILELDPDWSVQ
jgi:SAM-dependent methyltransferase